MPVLDDSVLVDPYLTDPDRLSALEASGLLSGDFSPSLDRWTRLAAGLIDAPLALLSLVDGDRQYFKSHVGLPDAVARVRETPLSHSFCQHVVSSQRPLIVSDAREDPLVRDNGAVADFGVIAYAGQPVTTADGHTLGSFCVIDLSPREWTTKELELLEDLAAGLLAEIELRSAIAKAKRLEVDLVRQAHVDGLTGLLNRRQLAVDIAAVFDRDDDSRLAVFDLDGFKAYNDNFGHPAGDALLQRMSKQLQQAVAGAGTAYRLGGDEFCVLAKDDVIVDRAVAALREHGAEFSITNSHGRVRLRSEVTTPEQAMQLADERLYEHKNIRSDAAQRQAHDVLLGVLREREPDLNRHVRAVARLARSVGVAIGLDATALDELTRAAEMHDIGKVAIPDSLLDKPGPLNAQEWTLMRQHTVLGERILRAAPSLAGVATLVRSSHERWDGTGYPDGLGGAEIPLGARIVFACDAFHAMTTDRPYRAGRTTAEALTELRREAGRQFDPEVISVLIGQLAERDARPGDVVAADVSSVLGPPLAA